MRRSLLWALVASGVLSAVALWTGKSERLVAAVQPAISDRPRLASNFDDRRAAGPGANLQPLPSTFDAAQLEPATRDFFQPVAAPVVATPVIAAAVQAPVAPPPPPPPPAMTYRYFGRMSTPEGAQLTYLSDGDKAIPVNLGDVLDNGYKVERIDEDGIHLVHGASGQAALVPIPMSSGS